jgi:hypothetical protein
MKLALSDAGRGCRGFGDWSLRTVTVAVMPETSATFGGTSQQNLPTADSYLLQPPLPLLSVPFLVHRQSRCGPDRHKPSWPSCLVR